MGVSEKDSRELVGKNEEVNTKQLIPKAKSSPPDGGYGWVIVICECFVFSVISFNVMAYGILLAQFRDVFGWSESEFGLLGSFRLGIPPFASAVSGLLLPVFGCRKMALIAVVVSSLGNILAAFATTKWMILATFGFLAGSGAGMVFIPVAVCLQSYFTSKRAIAAGLGSVGMSLFSIVAPPLLQYLASAFGWRGALLILGAINLQMLVPAALLRPLHHGSNKTGTNETLEISHDSDTMLTALRKHWFRTELFTIRFALYCISYITVLFIIDGFYYRMTPIGISIGFTPVSAALLPSVTSIFCAVGRGASGFLATFLTPMGVTALFNSLLTIIVFCVPFLPHSYPVYVGAAILTGFCIGNVFGMIDTGLVTVVGLDLLILGLVWFDLFSGICEFIANYIIGWLDEQTGTNSAHLWMCSTAHFIGSSCSIILVYIMNRRKRNMSHLNRVE